MHSEAEALRNGALNLLEGCAMARPGETLLILHEDPALGYYGAGLAQSIADVAESIGLRTRLLEVPFIADIDTLTPELKQVVQHHDHTLFLARLGDQLRFRAMPEGTRPIVSYALDRQALASPFGTAPHAAFAALKAAFNVVFFGAGEIEVTCPAGTMMRGRVQPADTNEPVDVSIKRFPVCVFAPLDAAGFSGRVAVAHLLVGTGSRYYQPFGIRLKAPLFAHIAGGRLQRWEGPAEEVQRARDHYAHVAGLFGIDGDVVHSWHAGIHPGCAFPGSAHDAYERWTGSAFGNPRLLHFHTCGAYAPGEICWNIVDPTIRVDGVAIWDRGRILIENVPGAAAVLARFPQLKALFANPAADIGLHEDGSRHS